MTDTDALTERIAKTICNTPDRGDEWRDDWSEIPEYDRDFWMDAATAVLPVVAVEVRKAKAEALREAAEDLFYDGDYDVEMRGYHQLHDRATEYETGDSDEHR